MRGIGSKPASKWMRIGRTAGLASVLVLVGTSAYAALSLGGGEVRHEQYPDDARARTTYIGFQTWSGIVPAPEFAEVAYRELQSPSGEWIKDGFYHHLQRSGFVLETGAYKNGLREGPWGFWTTDGRLDEVRSGLYADDRRVGPCSLDQLR